jgi:hypothetical protein
VKLDLLRIAARVAAKDENEKEEYAWEPDVNLKSHGEEWAGRQKLDLDEDIVAYVLRMGESQWGITEFDENVVENLKRKPPVPMSEEELMRKLPNKGVSLWMDGEGEDPAWISTGDPEFSDFLHDMEMWPGNPKSSAN